MQSYLRDLSSIEILPSNVIKDYIHYYQQTKDDPVICKNYKRNSGIPNKTLFCQQQVITSHLRLVISIAKNYRNCGIPFEDLISIGNLGLYNAIDNFDESKNCEFTTYAPFWIKEKILKALKKQKINFNIKVPEYIIDAMKKWQTAKQEFFNRNFREGTIAEINLACKFKPRVIEYIEMGINAVSIQSFLTNGVDVSDSIIDIKAEMAITKLIEKETVEEIQERIKTLPPRTADIVESRLNFITLKSLSEKYNISVERVRQVFVQGLKSIRLECLAEESLAGLES
jgi:RNA polymerase primary sigma factor